MVCSLTEACNNHVPQTQVMQELEWSLVKSHFIHVNLANAFIELYAVAHSLSLLHTYTLHTRMRKVENTRIHLKIKGLKLEIYGP